MAISLCNTQNIFSGRMSRHVRLRSKEMQHGSDEEQAETRQSEDYNHRTAGGIARAGEQKRDHPHGHGCDHQHRIRNAGSSHFSLL